MSDQSSIPPVEPTPPTAPPAAPTTPPSAPPAPPATPATPPPPPPGYYSPVPQGIYAQQPSYGPAGGPQQPYPGQPGAYPAQYPAYGGPAYAPQYAPPAPPSGLSITSMILGIAGVFFAFIYGFGLFPSIAAVITGHIARKRQPHARGMSLAGLICGYIGIAISLIAFAIIVAVIIWASNQSSSSYYGDY